WRRVRGDDPRVDPGADPRARRIPSAAARGGSREAVRRVVEMRLCVDRTIHGDESMKPSSVARRVVLVGALAFSRLAVATPEFTFIGDLPGGSIYSVAMGVSADGKYVVGGS